MTTAPAPRPTNFSLNFILFGVPVSIHPLSWVLLAFLGGAFNIEVAADLSGVLFFVVAAMLCLLVHEFGHALVGRRMGGHLPMIEIGGWGGVTGFVSMNSSRAGYFAMVAAGPLASLALGLFVGLLLGVQVGDPIGGMLYSFFAPCGLASVFAREGVMSINEALTEGSLPVPLMLFYSQVFLVCFWWSFINLLPIFPLDGGKLFGTLINNFRIASMVGIVLAGLAALFCLVFGMYFNACIAGYLAYINYGYLRSQG